MLLADLGAEIIRIDRIAPSDSGIAMPARFNLMNRGRRSIAMDLKRPEAGAAVLRMVARADGLIEGFRPGVTERMGLGPDHCAAVNPALVYGRMTGFGQYGPLSRAPGHDINYIALSGALHAIGEAGRAPVPPLNLVGDLGGGALYLALGMVSAILEARSSGRGQVVDAAMTEGAASLMALIFGLHAAGLWTDQRQDNRLDGGAPWYSVYQTKDGGYIALGSNEPRFYAETLDLLNLRDAGLSGQHDKAGWPVMRDLFAAAFRTRTRDEWCRLAEGREICLSPVLSLGEAPHHPHNLARDAFVERDGVLQPAPAPRFSRTVAEVVQGPAQVGEHSRVALGDWGFSETEVAGLIAAGAVAQAAETNP
jgi:alpha-methylacyl-CoA racemase